MKAKRIVAMIALVAMLTIALTGCVNMSINLKINADGSADYGMNMLMDESLLSMAQATGQDVWAEATKQLQAEGFTVTPVKQDNYSGINAMKHYEDVSKIGEDSAANSVGSVFGGGDTNSSFAVKADKGFFGTTYTVKSSMDVSKSLASATSGLDAASAQMLDSVKVTMVITLPVKAASHNATSVSADGLTYTWDLKLDQANSIDVAATVPNILNIALLGGGALLVVIVAVLVIVLVTVSSKKKKANASASVSEQ